MCRSGVGDPGSRRDLCTFDMRSTMRRSTMTVAPVKNVAPVVYFPEVLELARQLIDTRV